MTAPAKNAVRNVTMNLRTTSEVETRCCPMCMTRCSKLE
jgi:hypothetical protein